MNLNSIFRTIVLVIVLFVVIAAINALGRMAIPAVARVSPGAASILDIAF